MKSDPATQMNARPLERNGASYEPVAFRRKRQRTPYERAARVGRHRSRQRLRPRQRCASDQLAPMPQENGAPVAGTRDENGAELCASGGAWARAGRVRTEGAHLLGLTNAMFTNKFNHRSNPERFAEIKHAK